MTTDNIGAEFEKWYNTAPDPKIFEQVIAALKAVREETWQAATASMQAENQRLRKRIEYVCKDMKDFIEDMDEPVAIIIKNWIEILEAKHTTEGQ